MTPSSRRSETKRSSVSGSSAGVADAGVHVCMMPTQVSDSSGVRPPWWPLKRSWCDGLRAQPGHPAGRGQDADVGQAGAQARAGVREELGGQAHLGALAEPRRERTDDRLGVAHVQEAVARGARRDRLREVLEQRRPQLVEVVECAPTSIWPWSAVTRMKRVAHAVERVQRARARRRRTRRSTVRGGGRWRRSRPSRCTSARARAEPRGRLLEALERLHACAHERRRAVLARPDRRLLQYQRRARRAARTASARARRRADRAAAARPRSRTAAAG